MSTTEAYPVGSRRGVWALDYLKVINLAGIVDQVQAPGVALLMHVALAEHAKDYLSPPDFWASQLRRAAGIKDDEAFAACRRRCVDGGWLVYQAGPIRGVGVYWVQYPEALKGRLLLRSHTGQTGDGPVMDRNGTGEGPEADRQGTGNGPVRDRRQTGGAPVLPSPSPLPSLTRVCESTHTPAQGMGGDNRKENTEALKRAMRKAGLSVRGEAVQEWGDFLTGACRCKNVEECIWTLGWALEYGRTTAGIEVRFANHAKPMLGQILNAINAERKSRQKGKS